MKVLIADDSATSRAMLRSALTRWGYDVVMAEKGKEALDILATEDPPPMAVLDWVMPELTGPEVCRRVRETLREPYTYILLLTSKNTKGETVEGLEAGADDYIVKPFGFQELLARMRAVLRRTGSDSGVIVHGPLRVDLPARTVWVAQEPISLTGKEFDILACLALDPGRVVSREEIFDRVWDEHWYGPRKVLDVHIAALRRKLGATELIETVYGRGFRLSRSARHLA